MVGAFRGAVEKARREEGLCFASLLSSERILEAFGAARWRWQGWVYTPAVTVWVYLSQCLSPDHSCREAVAGLLAWRLARGEQPCSANTGAYCSARGKIPEHVSRELMRQTGRHVQQQAPADWLWHGHRVLDVDGSTVTLADTPLNQQAYPQQPGQKPGCGFPLVRLVVVFCLATGVVLEAALGKYQGKQTGENSLFRTLHEALHPNDVVLADRYYSGWFDLALLQQRQVHAVIRKHQLRPTDFRRGRRLGPDDHLVVWAKPPRPAWMSQEDYDALPAELTVREMRVRVRQKGFRTKTLLLVTTLLDAERYSTEALAQLYRRRWQAELHLRDLKVTLHMDHLRSKTPAAARKELYLHLTAYNLIRQTMALAALRAEREPWSISFKGTLQTLNRFLPLLDTALSSRAWTEALLRAIAAHVVGDRPDRVEPRVKKRRPKEYDLMTRPRNQYVRVMTHET
jgi:hypothetical protein